MHTNGPWEAREGVDNYPDWNVWNSNGWFVVACHSKDNARLIAAAPELLEAASAWIDCAVYDEDTHTWTVFEKNDEYHDLCSAISKAKSHADTLKGE